MTCEKARPYRVRHYQVFARLEDPAEVDRLVAHLSRDRTAQCAVHPTVQVATIRQVSAHRVGVTVELRVRLAVHGNFPSDVEDDVGRAPVRTSRVRVHQVAPVAA